MEHSAHPTSQCTESIFVWILDTMQNQGCIESRLSQAGAAQMFWTTTLTNLSLLGLGNCCTKHLQLMGGWLNQRVAGEVSLQSPKVGKEVGSTFLLRRRCRRTPFALGSPGSPASSSAGSCEKAPHRKGCLFLFLGAWERPLRCCWFFP